MVERYNVWGNDLSCGHDDIDADHQQIFDLAEHLRRLYREGKDETDINRAAIALLDRIKEHFAREEALMLALEYPEFSDHKLEHSFFLQSARNFHQSFNSGSHSSHKELWQFLRRWFIHHIFYADTQLATFLLDRKKKQLLLDASQCQSPIQAR